MAEESVTGITASYACAWWRRGSSASIWRMPYTAPIRQIYPSNFLQSLSPVVRLHFIERVVHGQDNF
jgi:hypothetical protein